MSLSPHLWTIWPLVRDRLRTPPPPPPEEPWSVDLDDPDVGAVRLTGRLARRPATALVVLVHGLGGSIDSSYMVRAARAADSLGLASLRLNLRGADRRGHDFYHAGLSGDLGRAVASPALAGFAEIYLMGFSLGGHLCLRFATEVEDPRVRAVAAVSSPLDLAVSVDHFDRPARWPYRRYVLGGLMEMTSHLRPAARQGAAPIAPLDELRRVRRLREWDRRTVVPRFGFADAGDYYRQASVGPRLHLLRRPALLVASDGDPLVAAPAVRRPLARYAEEPPASLRVEWVRGGHVSFPADLDLGQDGPPGIYGQVLAWLAAHGQRISEKTA